MVVSKAPSLYCHSLSNVPDELVPPVLLGNVLQRLELPRRHRTCANVPDPTLLNDIVQGLHDLLSRCVTVQAVDLEHIDICAETLDALLDGIEDVLAAETNLVDHLAIVYRDGCDTECRIFLVNAEVALGEEDKLLARDVVLLDGFGDDLLRDAVGVDIGLEQLSATVLRYDMVLRTVSHVLMPLLYACSRIGKAASSFRTQGCHLSVPKLIAPRMTFETFRPDFPRLQRSAMVHYPRMDRELT
jgi:hypothetical protein